MRTETVQLFQFAELSDAAKEVARDWWRGFIESSEIEQQAMPDILEAAQALGVEFDKRPYKTVAGRTCEELAVYWSGFGCQGDGASFDGQLVTTGTAADRVREEFPTNAKLLRIAEAIDALHVAAGQPVRAATKVSGHYYHARTMSVYILWDDYPEDLKLPDDFEEDLQETLREFADWIYRQLEEVNDWLYSEEAVDENLEINCYEFTADGEFWKG